jgi:mycobactin lysine-N-oxygenase
MNRLLIIGAGPKAMAIASKNKVYRQLGFDVPEIHLFEKNEVGANWTGCSGYTNGHLELGTPPEKDVGYPYQCACWHEDANDQIDRLMKDFSWQSFLVADKSYSAWVDRGRPAPQHRQWASYLKWVARNVEDEVTTHRGEVVQLRIRGQEWVVGYKTDLGLRTFSGDGLVVTGPGQVRMQGVLPDHQNLMTVKNFWSRHSEIVGEKTGRIAIVGSGESAAAVAMSLAQTGSETLRIDIISPNGMTFSRGESYRENRVYTDPDVGNWDTLTLGDRRQFIERTDRGVFSAYAQSAIDRADNVDVVPGRLREVVIGPNGLLTLCSEYNHVVSRTMYTHVVVATGADQIRFLGNMMNSSTQQSLISRSGLEAFEQSQVELKIGRDLAIENLTPRLHLPMLSGLRQGPGFANLSCLGRLSDRVLLPYLGQKATSHRSRLARPLDALSGS